MCFKRKLKTYNKPRSFSIKYYPLLGKKLLKNSNSLTRNDSLPQSLNNIKDNTPELPIPQSIPADENKFSRTQNGESTIIHQQTQELVEDEFPTNFIMTTRFTLWNFFPKCLLLQFKRYANIYFLMIAILQSFPSISPLHPFSAIAPLCFVLSLSLLREGYEDYQRHRSDVEMNKCACTILSNGLPTPSTWASIRVGQLLLVKNSEMIPADLMLISSSIENGVCYIETSSLDGEKNLKVRTALPETYQTRNTEKIKQVVSWILNAQVPDSNLNNFEGSLSIGQSNQKLVLTSRQLLLRGSKLKNTQWAIGAVIYTGLDTKIMRNSEKSKVKQSNIEKKTNKYIIGILVLQIIICFLCAITSTIYREAFMDSHYYLEENTPYQLHFIKIFFTYFLLNNTMIPISLIVSLEFVKFMQGYFMNKDEDMFVKHNGKYAKVMTSSVNEELGQVEYIFSDKTGTLTCNKMEFKGCCIGNSFYGEIDTGVKKQEKKPPSAQASSKRRKTIIDERSNLIFEFNDTSLKNLIKCNLGARPEGSLHIELKDLTLERTLAIFNSQQGLVHEFMQILATCHECIIDKDEKIGYIHYQSQSPDEIALVDAVRHLGYKFLGSSQSKITLEVLGERKEIELLHVLEFDSNRKRMTVIVREEGLVKLYMKGADTIIKSRLDTRITQPFLKYIEEKIDSLSKKGFRCLMIAMRILSNEEYEEVKTRFDKLAECENREKEKTKIADEIETNLLLIGSTVVEDRLQKNVPETISDMLRAEIKFWMLTGDKLETAENIGKSCGLIKSEMTLMRLQQESLADCTKYMDEAIDIYKECVINDKKKGLLIEGEALSIVLGNEDLKEKFLHISKNCEAVICCRVTPKQKADVVRLIKNNLNKITVAIGDGANDVNMIQEAHIGIGIYGQEGLRAVQSSDYAIGEFQCIWKLLLVHGRWSYMRISQMILYFFYKNMVVTIPQFFYSFRNFFSGQTIFDDWYITFYNLLFTALPLVIRAIFDQDIYYKVQDQTFGKSIIPKFELNSPTMQNIIKEVKLIKHYYPEIYYIGKNNTIFSLKNFTWWVVQGMFHALVIFLICLFTYNVTSMNKSGHNTDEWSFSIAVFTTVIMVVDLKLAIYTHSFTYLMGGSLVGTSIIVYYAYVFISDNVDAFAVYQTAVQTFTSCHIYFSFLFGMGLLLFFDICSIVLKKEFSNSLVDYFRYLLKIGKQDDANFYNKYLKSYQPARMSRKLSGFFTDDLERRKTKSKQKNNQGSTSNRSKDMKNGYSDFDNSSDASSKKTTTLRGPKNMRNISMSFNEEVDGDQISEDLYIKRNNSTRKIVLK